MHEGTGSKWLAFDIEIASTIPDDADDWSTLHPIGISCAATWASDEPKPRVWVGAEKQQWSIAAKMADEIYGLLDYLALKTSRGYRVVTVNGAGFDFRELAANCMPTVADVSCKPLALSHVDIFFDVFCRLGYSPGLDAMSKGMGLEGKMEGVDGALAPELWSKGEYGKVISYVCQDVRQTLDLVLAIERTGMLHWTSKSGRPNSVEIPQLLSVVDAMVLPEPDVSWMTEPWERTKFVGWLR